MDRAARLNVSPRQADIGTMYQGELEIREVNNETIRILRFSRSKYINVPWGPEYLFFNEILYNRNIDEFVSLLSRLRTMREVEAAAF